MAHTEQLKFVQIVRDQIPTKTRLADLHVLEIGSYDVNGSVRQLFEEADYMGVDISDGPGVDIVSFGHTLTEPDGSFDVSISCECFEHDPHWVETFQNMLRMTRDGGIVVFTCATTGRLEHGTKRTDPAESPGTQSEGIDYYENRTAQDFKAAATEALPSHRFFFYGPPAICTSSDKRRQQTTVWK